MHLSNFSLRKIPAPVMELLKRKAKEQEISINLLVLQLIEQGLGYSPQVKNTIHHD